MSCLNDYEPIVGAEALDELRSAAARLAGRRVRMVNATAVGGGVAEILQSLVPLLNELGITTRWDVLEADQAFFGVTKRLHRALQGGAIDPLDARDVELFLETNRANAARLDGDDDFVVVHDPQPVAMIDARDRASHSRWVWRCHIDMSRPQPHVWEFLQPFVSRYDAAIYSSEAFVKRLQIPQHVFHPPIDPLSDKNRELPAAAIDETFTRLRVPRDKPIVTQVSRFDRQKDPLGVLQAFKLARRQIDCRLMLVGGHADDDPEGAQVLAEVLQAADGDPDILVLGRGQYEERDINALVRGSTIVVQKSLREGFGLTVAEALWKRKPVIASAVGGLPLQVIDGVTGLLVASVEDTARRIVELLNAPERMSALGAAGRLHVQREFLITRNLGRWLALFAQLAVDAAPTPRPATTV